MSCQQASRIITTNATSSASPLVVHEDPYVFTETLSNTPPVLFNTKKLRNKLSSSHLGKTEGVKTTPVVNQNSQVHGKTGTKALASLVTPSLTAIITTTSLPTTKTNSTKNLNNVQQQSQKEQNDINQKQNAGEEKKSCTIKEQKAEQQTEAKQQQQQQYQQHHQQQSPARDENVCTQQGNGSQLQQQNQQQPQRDELFQTQSQQQQSPPPLYTPTPSLWQTPLLLDTLPGQMASPPTSPASLPSPTSHNGTVNSLTSLLISPISAQPLPPSKFHNTTLAQHLEKVECLKKPKRSVNNNCSSNSNNNNYNQNYNLNNNHIQKSSIITSLNSPPPLQALKTQKHSEIEMNNIPVNVIYRKATPVAPTTPNQTSFSSKSLPASTTLTALNDTKTLMQLNSDYSFKSMDSHYNHFDDMTSQYNPNLPLTPPSPTSLDQVLNPLQCPSSTVNGNTLLASPSFGTNFSNLVLKPLSSTTSSSSMQNTNLVEIVNANTPASLNNIVQSSSTSLKETNDIPALVTVSKNTVKRRASPSKNSCNTSSSQKKRKSSLLSTTNTSSSLPSSLRNDNNENHPVSSLGASKMSDNEQEEDDQNYLSDPTVLPFCLQKNWLNIYTNKALLPKSLNREERISHHRNLLRRQALQMLSVRSLQKLPLRLARNRLLTVDQLLQKYQDRNALENQVIKDCIIPGCQKPAMVMASHCLKHITNNNTQHIFLPCIAKTELNGQCNVPVFDACDDTPFCSAHIKNREEYKRNLLLEQQKVRKMALISSGAQTMIYEPKPQTVQHNYLGFVANKKVEVNKVLSTPPRKRKQNSNATNANSNTSSTPNNNNNIVRPQKRGRKPHQPPPSVAAMNSSTTPVTATMIQKTKVVNAFSPITMQYKNQTTNTSTPPPLTVVSQRKNSTTSLESIASNSHSSSSQSISLSNQHPHQQQHIFPNSSLPPPALAPLSNHSTRLVNISLSGSGFTSADLKQHEIQNIVSQLSLNTLNNLNLNNNNNNKILNTLNFGSTITSLSSAAAASASSNSTKSSSSSSTNFNQLIDKTNESNLNKLNTSNGKSNNGFTTLMNGGATFLSTSNNNNSLKLSNNNSNGSSLNDLSHGNANSYLFSNSNSNSSSALSAQNQFSPLLTTVSTNNEDFLGHGLQSSLNNHHLHQHQQQHQQQHQKSHQHNLHQQFSLQHSQYNKHHDMLSICENSSAYASSEDTGLGGGLSESELMSGAPEVDENPLGDDTRLLEEHDMANVLSTLPEDAFNELFNTVQEDECQEVERALELAEKHLKSLQQSIGSESDFLSDFFDVNDDLLADPSNDFCDKMEIVSSVMHSPDTSGIDTSLFIDSNGSNSGGLLTGTNSTNTCPALSDIRDLVQA